VSFSIEHSNEPSGCMKFDEFYEQMNSC